MLPDCFILRRRRRKPTAATPDREGTAGFSHLPCKSRDQPLEHDQRNCPVRRAAGFRNTSGARERRDNLVDRKYMACLLLLVVAEAVPCLRLYRVHSFLALSAKRRCCYDMLRIPGSLKVSSCRWPFRNMNSMVPKSFLSKVAFLWNSSLHII